MDFKVSRKERRWQPDGPIDVLVNNICDLYPVFANDPKFANEEIIMGQDTISDQDRENIIMDIEILDDAQEELIDRAMFAVMKQRGADPIEPDDGIQWAEAVIGEVPAPVILQQVNSSVSKEGPGVQATAGVVRAGNKENLVVKVSLTNVI